MNSFNLASLCSTVPYGKNKFYWWQTSSYAFSSIMRLVLFQQEEWKQTKGGLILRSIAHEQRQECFCTLRDVQKLPTLLQNSMSESMFCCWAWAETQGKIGYKSHQISFQVAVALLHHAEVCQQPGFVRGTEMPLAYVPAVPDWST